MAEKFDNPNYNPDAGMKYLATHFEMFKPEVAKAMIADAKRKGVKIPPVVEAKARKAGILNSARNAKFKVGDKVKFKNLFKPERGEETGVVTGYDTDGSVLIRDDDGIKVKASEKLVRLANSARNAKFKVGDTVEAIRDRVHKLGVKGTVLKVDADDMVVKWADDGFTASYGIEGNFKNLTKEPKATPEDKMKAELSRSGAGSNPRTAHTWLTRHRRGLVSKYGREVYEKVMREATRGLLNAQIRATNTKWVIYYWDGGKEKIEAPTREAAKREADKRSRKSGRGYKRVIFDDGVDYGINSVRSTNAVVAKAKAMNAWKVSDFDDAAKEVKSKYNVSTWTSWSRSGEERIDMHVRPNEDVDKVAKDTIKIFKKYGIDMKVAGSTPLHYMGGVPARRKDADYFRLIPTNAVTNNVVAKALNACARNKAPEGWWKGKTIFAAFGWGKSVQGKVVSHKGGIIKLEDGTTFKETDAYDLYAINSCAACAKNAVVAKALNAVRNAWADAPDAATAKRDIEQTVHKAAEIAKKRSGAKATYKLTPNDNYWCGYIELTFNTEEEAKNYNPYYLFNELGDNKSILPKWSWAISYFSYQKNGKVVKIFVGRLAT